MWRYLNHANRFLWARLQLQSLSEQKSDEAIIERLGNLPKKLRDRYEEIFSKIEGYTANADRRYAKNAFSWLLCARFELSSKAFLDAISEPGRTSISKEQLLDLCCNLITFDQALDIFRFAHLSVREFLESQPSFTINAVNAIVGEACLSLMFHQFEYPTCIFGPYEEFMGHRFEVIGNYATMAWPYHYRDAGDMRMHGCSRDLFIEFFSRGLEQDSPFSFWLTQLAEMRRACYPFPELLPYKQRKCFACVTEPINPISIYFTAFTFDFFEIPIPKNFEGFDPTLKNENGMTCLHLAVENGSHKILETLIAEKPSLVTSVTEVAAGSPVGEEIFTRFIDKVVVTESLLLAAASNPNGAGIMSQLLARPAAEITETVLEAAAGNTDCGHRLLIQLLKKSDYTITENLLRAAAWSGGEDSMALLLERNANLKLTEDIRLKMIGNYHFEDCAIIQFFQRDDVATTEEILITAIKERNGDLLITQLIEKYDKQITEDIVVAAAASWGGVEIASQLLQKGHVRITEKVIMASLKNPVGRSKMLQLLKQNDAEVTKST